MADSPFTGHFVSHMPQPMHRSLMTAGRRTVMSWPLELITGSASSLMALSETGHISSQTRQSRFSAKGMHRFSSMRAMPMTIRRFSSRGNSGMAPVGQTSTQSRQAVHSLGLAAKLRSGWMAAVWQTRTQRWQSTHFKVSTRCLIRLLACVVR